MLSKKLAKRNLEKCNLAKCPIPIPIAPEGGGAETKGGTHYK